MVDEEECVVDRGGSGKAEADRFIQLVQVVELLEIGVEVFGRLGGHGGDDGCGGACSSGVEVELVEEAKVEGVVM
eukprot:744938-Karenia_brevis.AAC.1